jgi:hypothetical protein
VPLLFLIPLVILCGSSIRLVIKTPPGPVPPDVCALVPADLLQRVVPAAKMEEPESKNSETFTNVARCSGQTDSGKAGTTAHALLRVELRRYGTLAGASPGQHAHDEFAGSKKFALKDQISPARVFDVGRLGDSAFVSVDEPSVSDRQEHRSVVDLQVLMRERTLRLYYYAEPTTDDLAVAAVVAVARALLGALR